MIDLTDDQVMDLITALQDETESLRKEVKRIESHIQEKDKLREAQIVAIWKRVSALDNRTIGSQRIG